MPFCPVAEPTHGPHIGRTRVGIADVGCEELDKPPDRVLTGILNERRNRDTGGRGKLTIAGNEYSVVQLRRKEKMLR